MGKRGPCFHCGIDSTPLWRNGPPEKPVLCNACGSRYRIRGTLENYIPKLVHSLLLNKRPRKSRNIVHKGNLSMEEDVSGYVPDSTGSEDDIGDKSTSDSAMSCVKSCTKLEHVDDPEEEIPGNCQPNLWESHIPSRKRSVMAYRSLSPIERLQRDLFNLLKYQGLTESPEEVLIYKVKDQMSSNEIGLGGILLKPHNVDIRAPFLHDAQIK